MTEGPRLSLKAIAEQAVRSKNEAHSPSTDSTGGAVRLRSPEPPQADSLLSANEIGPPARLPAPPPMPRGMAKPIERSGPSTSLLLPATLIAIISAALAGGIVWWFAQDATPTAPAAQPTTAANPPAAPPTAAANATAASSATAVASVATPDTAAIAPSAAPTALTELPAAASTASARGPATPQPAKADPNKSAEPSSADIAKAIANHDPTAGPVLTGSGPPVVAPGPNSPQEAPSDLTPSSGAVQAAVGSVLGNARVCVAGDREASRARVVFGSSGSVSQVTVTGPAAGTPAESCIKAALSKARVAPFQKANYSVDTTIRP
jgi:hypothetical protein